MSKFADEKLNLVSPYIPGEQPRDRSYIKLNTNENPFYTCARAVEAITAEALKNLNRYSDPKCALLTAKLAEYYGVSDENVLVTNGSDEALAFAFFAYCTKGVRFPDVTYGFYDVIANLYACPVEHVMLDKNYEIDKKDLYNAEKTVVFANPNAQTGIEMSLADVEDVVKNNMDNVVIVDQAYADFGDSNAIPLTENYENLLIIGTFSKSRSLAGARVGFAIGNRSLIDDLKKVKNSFHPYNVNAISQLLAVGAFGDDEYFRQTVSRIKTLRKTLTEGLEELGFEVLPSSANFVLAKHAKSCGEELYRKLKQNGVLVRHFDDDRIRDFLRITVGTDGEIEKLLKILKTILAEL